MKTAKKVDKKKHVSKHNLWLYGLHACIAAIENPQRIVHQLLVTPNMLENLRGKGITDAVVARCTQVSARELESKLPPGAIHQGIAVRVDPLPAISLDEILDGSPEAPLIILDQVNDPQNIGAILRSAAAFGAAAVLMTDRNAPLETAAMAKAASGALDIVPVVRLPNLAKALEILKKHNYWCIGLDGHAQDTIEKAFDFPRVAIVLGAEGKGLRRLTRELCDLLVKLPINEKVESLNVSNAAAITLYALSQAHKP